jgi:hypothetical protein
VQQEKIIRMSGDALMVQFGYWILLAKLVLLIQLLVNKYNWIRLCRFNGSLVTNIWSFT